MRNFALIAVATLGEIIVGCAAGPARGPVSDAAAAPSVDRITKQDAAPVVFANQLGDGRGARMRVVQLDVYQLLIPLGAISRSEEFWKHVDEQQGVDVGTYDLLRKNGWRIGVAPTNEWGYFRDIIDQYPASSKPSAITAGPGATGAIELTMKKAVPYENVFYFNDENALFGRTFERSDNLLSVTVQQVPRKPNDARVTVCPFVRSIRKRFEVSMRNDERVIEYVYPEHLYDLNLQTDIPAGQFMVIAPSPEVKWKTSLGATFLVQDGAAEQLEQVILLVPHVNELEESTPRVPVPAAAP
jgi:hypothetical protein